MLQFSKMPVLDLGSLGLNPKTLSEVTVKGQIAPVVIKKDTIEFNAEAFKVRPNAVVQELLKKLPGVQVDRDGMITYIGREVSKVKVDGRDFFANDPKIATQNLDADMISKVQIYNDREGDPDHLLPDYKVGKIINLKLKKNLAKLPSESPCWRPAPRDVTISRDYQSIAGRPAGNGNLILKFCLYVC
jgi:hypothetical protein